MTPNTLKVSYGKRNLIAVCAAAALILVMIIIGVVVYGASAGSLLIMAGFVLLYMQLPGLVIVNKSGLGRLHLSTRLAIGLFAGWSLNIILYFISDFIRTDFLLYTVPLLISLYWIISCFRNNKGIAIRELLPDNIPISFCIFIVLVMLYCMLDTQYNYLTPALSDFTYLNPDKAYHIGLVNSLAHDYPLQSPWINGRYITYHIFGEMLFAVPVKLFGLESDFITLSFGPILTTYSFSISLYSFFKEMTSHENRAGIYCLIMLLSNIYVTRNTSSSLAFKFILENDNSAGYGAAAVLVMVVLFREWYKNFTADTAGFLQNRSGWIQMILCTLFIMLTTGIKGPMGAVITGGLWGTFLLGMILRKMPLKSFVPLIIYTIGFGFIYFTVLGSKGQTNGGGNSIIAFATISDIAFWKKPLIEAMTSIGIPYSIRLLVIFVVFLMFFMSIYFIPFCIGYIRELFMVVTGRKEFEPHKVLVYAECAVGLIGMFILNYSGHSQIYFGLVTVVFVPAVATWFLEDMEEERSARKAADVSFKVIMCCMAIGLVFTTISLGSYYHRHINGAIKSADPSAKHSKYLSISNEEYQSMEWLRENSDEDDLIATDRYYSVSPKKYSVVNRWDNRFFLYAVYSNRFCYIAGSGYNLPAKEWQVRRDMINTNNELYDADNEERGDLARELSVDYVVVSKRFTDPGDLSNEDYSRCYENSEVVIYKIEDDDVA